MEEGKERHVRRNTLMMGIGMLVGSPQALASTQRISLPPQPIRSPINYFRPNLSRSSYTQLPHNCKCLRPTCARSLSPGPKSLGGTHDYSLNCGSLSRSASVTSTVFHITQTLQWRRSRIGYTQGVRYPCLQQKASFMVHIRSCGTGN